MKKKYQITEFMDWFYEKELIEKIKKMRIGDKITIIRLDESYKEKK